MGHHKLHFSDREAAKNWAENYGGRFHDNMHTRGDDRGTNFTVTEEFEDDGYECTYSEDHEITKEFPKNTIVYHWKYGKGVVRYRDECDMHNGHFQVIWRNDGDCSYYEADERSSSIHISMLSFTPYTLENGGFSRDIKNREANNG